MRLNQFNALTCGEAMKDLLHCCGSRRWATQMAARRPFRDVDAVFAAADQVWARCDRADVLEAFRQHPKVGEAASLRVRPPARTPQADELARRLSAGNEAYEQKFGHRFVVCATGRTADEILALLEQRMGNSPAVELKTAAAEQARITRIRLGTLLQEETLAQA